MNYGDTFVASTAALHSRTQALKALVDADAFDGPSVVLAYTPVMSQGSPVSALDEVNRAVADVRSSIVDSTLASYQVTPQSLLISSRAKHGSMLWYTPT